MSDTVLRHWHLLRLLPRAPRKVDTARISAELADCGFNIDKRTIQRDLVTLSSFFPLECDMRSKPYGWSWSRDAAPFDVPGMDVHTALAFRLARDHLTALLPATIRAYLEPHFSRADAVLRQVEDGALASWADNVRAIPCGQPLEPPEIDPIVLETVHTALLRQRRLYVSYRRRGEQELRRYRLDPLGLVYRDAVAYLVATAWDYDDVLQFALHRMADAEPCDEPVQPPPGFELQQYVRSGAFGFLLSSEPLQLEALVHSLLATKLAETPLSPDQQLEQRPGGQMLVRATVSDTVQLRTWLLSQGEFIDVLAPAALRLEVAETLREAALHYEQGRDEAERQAPPS